MTTTDQLRKLQRERKFDEFRAKAAEVPQEEKDDEIRLLEDIVDIFQGEVPDAAQRLSRYSYDEGWNPAQRSDYALLALLAGENETAAEILKGLIDDGEADAVDYSRAAAIAASRQDLEEAKRLYLEAVNREPGRAEWHNNLGSIYAREMDFERAIEQYEMALRIDPELVLARELKDRILVALDRADDLIDEARKALEENPDDFESRMRLIRLYMGTDRIQEALATIMVAIVKSESLEIPGEESDEETRKIYAQQMAYREILLGIYMKRNMFFKALSLIEDMKKLLEEEKHHLPLAVREVEIWTELERFEKAHEALIRAREIADADLPALKAAEADLLSAEERYEEAEAIYRELLETYPGNASYKSKLGQVLLWLGRMEEASELFSEAAEINPLALSQMVSAKKYPTDSESLKLMERLADNPTVDRGVRESMGFALAQIHEKQKRYKEAFHYLKLANDLVDKEVDYRPEHFSQTIDRIIDIFSREFIEGLPSVRRTDRTPIFIVGMPRSGTTLTEQILCSHPEIFGAGELPYISQLSQLIPRVTGEKTAYPLAIRGMTPHLREEAARFYLSRIGELDQKHPFVVDKMPHNFIHVGLIRTILPNAKIIHIQRDPRDTALSNYQQNFKAKHGGMGYSFDLVKIARQINDYHRLMEHWRKIGIPMFELTYEELVADQEGMTRELLEYVGVEWDEGVRDFHKTERAVKTASVAQVRQPIYQSSKQKWRRYEEELAPLIEHLDPELLKRWDRHALKA